MHDQVGHYRNRPIYRAVNDTSYHTAMFAVQGILAALRVAWITGRGQLVDTSLLRGITAPNNPWRRFDGRGHPPRPVSRTGQHRRRAPGRARPRPPRNRSATAIPSQLCTQAKTAGGSCTPTSSTTCSGRGSEAIGLRLDLAGRALPGRSDVVPKGRRPDRAESIDSRADEREDGPGMDRCLPSESRLCRRDHADHPGRAPRSAVPPQRPSDHPR